MLLPFLRTCGYTDGLLQWLPAVGPTGDNVVHLPSGPGLATWWRGPTLLQVSQE